jgi:hypothetical protein
MAAYQRIVVRKDGTTVPRTPNYMFTVDHQDDYALVALRRRIRELNKVSEFPCRVTVRARAPQHGEYTWGGGLTYGINDGTRFDVYVHDRY